MKDLEPFYNWLDLYNSSEDELSPYSGTVYSEFEYSNTIYNFYIHPQWDKFGSSTLYLKVIFADYEHNFAVLEFIGEWNDALYNDIMFLKRELIEPMILNGINKFVLIGENVLNFHGSDDCYYEEWFQEVEEGWIAAINFRPHVLSEMSKLNLDYYMITGGELDELNWRNYQPLDLMHKIDSIIAHRLN